MIVVNDGYQTVAQKKMDDGRFAILDLNGDGKFFSISRTPYSDEWTQEEADFHANDLDGELDPEEYQAIYEELAAEAEEV